MNAVTISKMEDGTFCVEPEGAEPEMEPGAEGTQADMNEDRAEGEAEQYCSTLDEALEAARQLLAGADGGAPMMDGEAAFVAGFKEAGGTPL